MPRSKKRKRILSRLSDGSFKKRLWLSRLTPEQRAIFFERQKISRALKITQETEDEREKRLAKQREKRRIDNLYKHRPKHRKKKANQKKINSKDKPIVLKEAKVVLQDIGSVNGKLLLKSGFQNQTASEEICDKEKPIESAPQLAKPVLEEIMSVNIDKFGQPKQLLLKSSFQNETAPEEENNHSQKPKESISQLAVPVPEGISSVNIEKYGQQKQGASGCNSLKLKSIEVVQVGSENCKFLWKSGCQNQTAPKKTCDVQKLKKSVAQLKIPVLEGIGSVDVDTLCQQKQFLSKSKEIHNQSAMPVLQNMLLLNCQTYSRQKKSCQQSKSQKMPHLQNMSFINMGKSHQQNQKAPGENCYKQKSKESAAQLAPEEISSSTKSTKSDHQQNEKDPEHSNEPKSKENTAQLAKHDLEEMCSIDIGKSCLQNQNVTGALQKNKFKEICNQPAAMPVLQNVNSIIQRETIKEKQKLSEEIRVIKTYKKTTSVLPNGICLPHNNVIEIVDNQVVRSMDPNLLQMQDKQPRVCTEPPKQMPQALEVNCDASNELMEVDYGVANELMQVDLEDTNEIMEVNSEVANEEGKELNEKSVIHEDVLDRLPERVAPQWLSDLLEATRDGKAIKAGYSRNKELSDASRWKLCDLIIKNELKGNPDVRITSLRFEGIAHDIVKFFPTENISTFYETPANSNHLKDNGSLKGCFPKGKLWNKYLCIQRRLRRQQLISIQKKPVIMWVEIYRTPNEKENSSQDKESLENVETPSEGGETETEDVEFETETEDVEIETDDSQIEIEDFKIEIEDFKIDTDDKIKAEDVQIKTEDTKIKTEDVEIKTEDLEIKTEDLEIKTEDVKIKTEEILSEDMVIPSEDVIIPSEDVVIPTKDGIIPPEDVIIPPQDLIIPSKDVIMPRVAIPQVSNNSQQRIEVIHLSPGPSNRRASVYIIKKVKNTQ